jgi:hypothetical protein
MGYPYTPVPQFDRTVLRLCSAVQLGPLALRMNGPSDSARRRAARPPRLSSPVPEPRHKSYEGIPSLQHTNPRCEGEVNERAWREHLDR